MGFADSVKQYEKFGDKFSVGDVFTIEALRVGPTLDTDFGPSETFIVKVDGTEYRGFGAGIINQARQSEESDFPTRVQLIERQTGKGNPMKQLHPQGVPYPEDMVAPQRQGGGFSQRQEKSEPPVEDDDIPF